MQQEEAALEGATKEPVGGEATQEGVQADLEEGAGAGGEPLPYG